MRIVYVFLCLFLAQINLIAQNLIKNPSFEEYSECPNATEQFTGYVNDWTSFFGTPDYKNLCGYAPDAEFVGIYPRSGNGYVSTITYNFNGPETAREYIHGELVVPLEEGKSYYFEYYVHPFLINIATNQHSAHFSQEYVTNVPPDDNISEYYLALEPHIDNPDSIYTEQTWIKTSGCYTATGGERYVVLGNFVSNAETDTIYKQPNGNGQVEFVLIDDVSMYSLESLLPDDTEVFVYESVSLPVIVEQSYRYAGETITGGSFSSAEAGSFEIEVYLEDCGRIGSFFVEVIDCTDLEAEYDSVTTDTTVCVEDNFSFDLFGDDNLEFFVNNEQIMLSDYVFDDTLTTTIYIGIDECDIVDSLTVTGEICDFELPVTEKNDCFYIPNAFSPNSDGYNDKFEIYGDCPVTAFELIVFDRWGNYLYRSDDFSAGWNGEFRNLLLETGVYTYAVTVAYIDETGFPAVF